MKPGFGLVIAAITAATAILALAQGQQPGDPNIDGARKTAAVFAQSLPDYVVRRTTTRYQGLRTGGPFCSPFGPDPKASHAARRFPSETIEHWQKLDVVAGDVTYEHGADTYTNIVVNGKPARNPPARGIWAAGEFSAVLLGILDPASAARFTSQHAELTVNHPSYRFDYAIDAAHSTWHLEAERPRRTPLAPYSLVRYSPAYDGAIWIDQETRQVLRVEMSARGVPADFPLSAVESATDYDFVTIGKQKYLLPVHSESWSCQGCSNLCFRNETDFRNYRKFGAHTNITFDSGK